MTDRELMQQALGALEGYARNCRCEGGGAPCDAAKALRARLAQPEPYAAQAAMVAQQTQGRMYVDPVTGDVGIGTVKWDASAPLVVTPHPAFQATPPQREWQGLTDEEITACIQMGESGYLDGFIKPLATFRDIEAKLKEKNGY